MPRWPLRALAHPHGERDPVLESRKNCYLGAEARESRSLLQRACQCGVFLLRNLVSVVRREQLVEKGGRYG